VFPEKSGTFYAIFSGFNTTGGCLILIENNIAVTGFGKSFQQRTSYVFGQGRIEIIACADNDTKAKLLFV